MTQVPRVLDMQNKRHVFLINQFMTDLRKEASTLTFLDTDGAIGDGRKATNFAAVWVVYTSNGTQDTDDSVSHNLGRIPLDMWIGIPDVSAIIYEGTVAWTSTTISLRASAATVTVNLLLF